MPAKEEHGCDSGSESIDKHEPRDILQDVITVSLLQKGHNDRTKNVVFVFNGIQWPMHNFELSATTYHNTSGSKTVGLVHTLVCRTFPIPAVHTMTSIA
jgi:hypothetical protein